MTFVLDVLVSLVGILALAQHTWALRGHFVSEQTTNGAKFILSAATLACVIMLVLTWSIEQPVSLPAIGLVGMGLSLALFWSAVNASRQARLRYAFDEALPSTLVTSGPYQFVRHPFYTAYLIFWLAWALASGTVWAAIPVALMFTLYVNAARFEERLLASSSFAPDYLLYKRRTGMFFPKLRAR